MKQRTRVLLAVLGLTALALAADTNRIITIKGRFQGDLRNGPYTFKENPVATVQNLTIKAPEATLSAPDGLEMSKAEGKRIANFTGNVEATRGRLTAKGPSLEYRESTGLGVLAGPVNIVQKPQKAGDDDVVITAAKATFDVDTNVSTSEGTVKLVNGNQTAQSSKVVYDEDSSLGCLTDGKTVTVVREPKKKGDNRLVITAKDVRVNTDDNTLVATGTVRLEAGDNVTTGEGLYYDDAKDTAWVIGDVAKKIPAKNVNRKSGSTITAGTIINYTKSNRADQLGNVFKIPVEKFKCPTSK